MKILIFIGMTIIFISVFFILFIFDTVVKEQIKCMAGFEADTCDLAGSGRSLMIGLALIAMFLLIDSCVLYMVIKTITESGSTYVAYSADRF